MVSLDEVFSIRHGNKFDMNKMGPGGIAFIGRSASNNGVTGRVSLHRGIDPYPGGLITVALGGSVLSSFVQPEPFYTGQNVAVLTPIRPLTIQQKLFYCAQIQANAFRFKACGREANRFLGKLDVEAVQDIPAWVATIDTGIADAECPACRDGDVPELDTSAWTSFEYADIFEIKKGKRLTKAQMTQGDTPFVSAAETNNGITAYVGQDPNHKAGSITVAYNGNGVAEAFYQARDFFACDDVNVLYPKFRVDGASALFVCALIRLEKYRFSYGRKWHLERMLASTIRLPADRASGAPDTAYMASVINSLPFSSQIAT